ncbi:outer membrane protein transport protein [Mangrovivirga sp. M17]|uniref:Outer membrane protein transport protein n=1 Tax=Mangrovivirga halotolerans TaxID=2993936 RepID=A0ABT3RNN9_9BACT|nr:outer membrane protein transport protein [Mangrovivirga halotolerans]MCX2743417.1 outer membrane protein transport protein [Mangrovivirga halotolerans]
MISLNKIYITLLILIFNISLSAQTYVDIVEQASNTEISGTARMQALGGAQVSLGGDVSSLYSNPAGLGFFNKRSFALTGGLNFISSKANFYNSNTKESDFRFNTPTLGIVFQSDGKNNGLIKSHGFGISLTSSSIFNRNEYFTSSNSNEFNSDFFDYIYSLYDPNQFNPEFAGSIPELAYNAFLVDEDAQGLYYIEDIDGEIYPPLPSSITYSADTKGQNSSFNTSYGLNINDRVYLGVGLNFQFFDYTTETFYTETRSDAALRTMNYNQFVDTYGAGISATLGIITRPINNLTLGLSYQTRTSYTVNEDFEILVQGIFNNYEYDTGDEIIILTNETASISSYDYIEQPNYRFTTPSKTRIGATYLFGKKGFITFDAEHVNYSGMELKNDSDINFDGDNQFIEDNYQSVWNIRTGLEYRLTNKLYLRGGYANYANPRKDNINAAAKKIYSGGMGYRSENGFFIDFTYQYKSQTNISRAPFTLAEPYASEVNRTAPSAKMDRSTSSILATIGKSF